MSNRYGIGQAVRRVEDQRFLTGKARYVGFSNLPAWLAAKAITFADDPNFRGFWLGTEVLFGNAAILAASFQP